MRTLHRSSTLNQWIVIAAATVAVVFGVLLIGHQALAADSNQASINKKLVTIHDRGKEIGILTDARTVREALEDGNIAVDERDLVEPALSEELVAKSYDVNIYRARPVIIIDGAVTQKVLSPYQTSKQIAKDAGIVLHDEDITTVEPIVDVAAHGAGIQVTVDRAVAFTLVLYGKKIQAYSQETTVGAMMRSKGIKLGKNDTTSVPQTSALSSGMTVEIWRNGKQTITVEEDVDFPVEKIQDADREAGYRQVKTPGEKGKRTVTYEIVMKNGVEVSKKEIQSVVLKAPKKQVEVVGAKVEGPEAIIAKIRTVSQAKGIDVQRVLLIAQCESRFNPLADSGYYKGIFQHDPNYWAGRAKKYGFEGASYFDVDAQIGVSTSMMAGGGWSHWGCDPGPQQ